MHTLRPGLFEAVGNPQNRLESGTLMAVALAHLLVLTVALKQLPLQPEQPPQLISVSLLNQAPHQARIEQSTAPAAVQELPKRPIIEKPAQTHQQTSEPAKPKLKPLVKTQADNSTNTRPEAAQASLMKSTEPQPAPLSETSPQQTATAEPNEAPETAPANQTASLSLPSAQASHLSNPKPLYPRISRRMGEEGTVLLKVLILSSGRAGKVEIAKSSGHRRLDMSALEAVESWTFIPAKQNGQPIDYWHVQPVNFTLTD